MKKKVFILVIALLQTILFSAQNSELKLTDSIANAQKEQKAKHLDSMVKHIRKQFYGNNLDVAIELGEPTLELANELNNLKAIVAISSLMGNAFLKVEDTLQAKRIFTNAIEKAEKEHDSTRVITTARIDLGNYYALQSKRKEAIEINLEKQEIKFGNNKIEFDIDLFKKKCLLDGLDDIALSLEKVEKISSFEDNLKNQKPLKNHRFSLI